MKRLIILCINIEYLIELCRVIYTPDHYVCDATDIIPAFWKKLQMPNFGNIDGTESNKKEVLKKNSNKTHKAKKYVATFC